MTISIKKGFMKNTAIRWLMKLNENQPQFGNFRLAEVFRHSKFKNGTPAEQEEIMLKSSEMRYLEEFDDPIGKYFSIDLIPLIKGKRLLDLGCFTGGKAIAWAERFQAPEVYGIDVNKVYMEAAQRFAKKKNVKAGFVASVGENLPFKDETFDVLISYDVFEHVQEVRGVLNECFRVLRSKGILVLVFPSYFHPMEHHLDLVTRTPFLHWFFSGEDLLKAYNEILASRGEKANWYKRENLGLQNWERCKGINGMTKYKFRRLIKQSNWKIVYGRPVPIYKLKASKKGQLLPKAFSYLLTPFSYLPGFEEFVNSRIVYILQKP